MINKIANNWLHPKRIIYAIIGFSVACLVSFYGPKVYLQFFDQRKYINIPNLVTFDRKVYSAGEDQLAKLTLKIDVDSDIKLKSRLMLILLDNQFKVVRQSEVDSFVVAKDDPQTFIVPAKLPCDLEEGQYLYRGEIQYELNGIKKFTDFDTDIFIIDNQREASDSAQIARNCNAPSAVLSSPVPVPQTVTPSMENHILCILGRCI